MSGFATNQESQSAANRLFVAPVSEHPRTAHAIRGFYFVKGFSFSYFALFAFSALNFAQRAFVNFEILALPAADMVRLRLTPLGLTSFELTEAGCEPFNARIAP